MSRWLAALPLIALLGLGWLFYFYALNRGMGLEALLADQPEADHDQRFEELFLAYAMGLIRARPPSEAPAEGRLP